MLLVDRKMKSIEVIGTLKILKKCIVGEHFYIRKLCIKCTAKKIYVIYYIIYLSYHIIYININREF